MPIEKLNEQEFEKHKPLIERWYSSDYILFEIVKNLKYREAVFINYKTANRCLKINALIYLLKNFKRYSFIDGQYNLYYSLALFPDLPMFSFNRFEKMKQQREFNKEHIKYIKGYDFAFDIDNKDIEKAKKTAIKIKNMFDELKIIYTIKFSGTKGFHIRIPFEYMPKRLKDKIIKKPIEMINKFKELAENFSLIYGFDDIDLGIFDSRRIFKAEYSLVFPSLLIAMPLTDEQLINFKKEDYHISRWAEFDKMRSLKNRGILLRNSKPENINNFYDFFKKYTT